MIPWLKSQGDLVKSHIYDSVSAFIGEIRMKQGETDGTDI